MKECAFNVTHMEKLCFIPGLIQYQKGWLAASDLSDMFTQSIKFYYIPLPCIKGTLMQI